MNTIPYWSRAGKYQADFDRYAAMMPRMGKSGIDEIEMVRAVNRIAHDFYNNGFGNNWSGALVYLHSKMPLDKKIYDKLEPYSTGVCFPRMPQNSYEFVAMSLTITKLINTVLEFVKEKEVSGFTKSDADYLNFQLPSYDPEPRFHDWNETEP